MSQDRGYMGKSPHVPYLRSCGLLQRLQKQTREQTLLADRTPDYEVSHARGRVQVVFC
jgi:hypothetical protein